MRKLTCAAGQAAPSAEGTPVVTRQHAGDSGGPAAADGDRGAASRSILWTPPRSGTAVEILRRERPVTPEARFVSVTLHEPPKDQVAFAVPPAPVPREAFVVLLEPRQHATYEAVVSLTAGSVLSWRSVPDARGALHRRGIRPVRGSDQGRRADPGRP